MTTNGHGLDADAYYTQWGVFQETARRLLQEAAGAGQNQGKEVEGILWTSKLTDPGRLDVYLNSSQYIIQIWSTSQDPVITEALTNGYRVIFSNYDAWYLDCGAGAWVGEGNNWCSPYKGWQTVYDNSPYGISLSLTGSPHTELILGGEAAIWSEQADTSTIDSKVRKYCGRLKDPWDVSRLQSSLIKLSSAEDYLTLLLATGIKGLHLPSTTYVIATKDMWMKIYNDLQQ